MSTPGRPGVRLNLLEQLTVDAVASDYAQVEPGARTRASRRQQLLVAAIGLGLAGFVLAMGFSARVLSEPVVSQQRSALMERIRSTSERQVEAGQTVEDLRVEVRTARADSLAISTAGRSVSEQIATLELVAGYTPVQGPGVVVAMDDAVPRDDVDPELQKVLDSDVQEAVNGLWEAGAEAIAINSQRLTARTAIRSAAGAILVNYRPLRPPYRIEAIGDGQALYDGFVGTQSAASLRQTSKQFGIRFSTTVSDSLRLPAATGPLPQRAEVVTPREEAKQ